MQTRKRVSGRNACREYASPKVSRAQKKSEKLQGPEKKAAELITSSARKQRVAGTLLKKSEEFAVTSNLTASLDLMYDDTSNTCLNKNAVNDAHLESKGQVHGGHGGEAGNGLDNIFSPAFHVSKIYGGHISSGDILEDGAVELSQNNWVDGHIEDAPKLVSGAEMLVLDSAALNSHCGVDLEGVALSSEVSAIYLAMKNSKLECVDEHGQDSLSTEIQVEDEYEEFDEFDPYLFIKNLPALSSVVPTFRPVLLPKQTRRCPHTTLVLDLDETLVHSTLEPCNDADFTFPVNFNDQEHIIYVRCRPHLMDFLERVARIFEIIIFTASQSIYAEQLLNVLDPKRKVFRHRVFRESCVFVDGNYLKDLSILGRDLAHVIIIDNSPQAFGFQVDNGIPIESWFDDRSDQELLLLLPFLESLVEVEDVRPLIAKKFNLREKVAAAVCPPMCSNEGDPLER